MKNVLVWLAHAVGIASFSILTAQDIVFSTDTRSEAEEEAAGNIGLLDSEMRLDSVRYLVGEDVCGNFTIRNSTSRVLTIFRPFTARGVQGLDVLERHSRQALDMGIEYASTRPHSAPYYHRDSPKVQIKPGEVIGRRICSSDASWHDAAPEFPRHAGRYRVAWSWGKGGAVAELDMVMPKRVVLLKEMVVSRKLIQPPPRKTDDHVGEPDPYETLYTTLLAIEDQDGTAWLGYIVPSIGWNGFADGMAPQTLSTHNVFRRVEKIAAVPSKVEANVVGKDLDVYFTVGSRVEKRTLKDLLR